MESIPSRIDSTFRYILVASRRAEQLMRGAHAKVELPHQKPTRVAMREVSDDLIDWDYGAAPVEEPLPADSAEIAETA